MLLLQERQAAMREIASGLQDGTVRRKEARSRIRELIAMEEKSAEGSRQTIERSDHSHVKKSGQAALRNREKTIELLREAYQAISAGDGHLATELLIEASNAGGKKSAKAARKAPTVALYVQYLAETDSDFREWLASQGITV